MRSGRSSSLSCAPGIDEDGVGGAAVDVLGEEV
jgi:hypothetical protein